MLQSRSRVASEGYCERGLGIVRVEHHRNTNLMVHIAHELLMKGLLLLQTADEDLEELFQRSYREIFAAVVFDRHLLHLRIFFYQLLLLSFQRLLLTFLSRLRIPPLV